MSVIRQQRTRNLRNLDPGQGPLPVLFTVLSARWAGSGPVALTFAEPVRMLGIPPVALAGGSLPLTAVQISDTQIELQWSVAPGLGEVLTLPDWCQELRGVNGEWVSGTSVSVNGPVGGALPSLCFVVSVAPAGGNDYLWTWSQAFAPDFVGGMVADGNFPTATSQTSGTETLATYPGSSYSGAAWGVGQYTVYDSVSGLWLSPGAGNTV